MDTNKVWIVIEGEYSGFNIVAVFGNKHLANNFVALQGSDAYEHWRIEEYTIDSYQPQINHNLKFFEVIMDKDGNNRVESKSWAHIDNILTYGVRSTLCAERGNHRGDENNRLNLYGREDTGRALLKVNTFAKNEQDAVIIADMQRVKAIDSGDFKFLEELVAS